MNSLNFVEEIEAIYDGTPITIVANGSGVTVHGDLDLQNEEVGFPEVLIVKGSLFMEGARVVKFPNRLVVDGDVYIDEDDFFRICEVLEVGGEVLC